MQKIQNSNITFDDRHALPIECRQCGKSFIRKWFNNCYCSKSCGQKWDYLKHKAGTEKERARCREKSKRLQHNISNRFQVYKRNAINAGLEFELTKELLAKFTAEPCFYCGIETPVNGVDRVDSSLGYIKGNMVSCCKYCNRAKSDLTQVAFYEMCARVTKNHPVPITFG